MRNIVVLGLVFLLQYGIKAQERITNNHFFLNPYIYNPAFAGKDGRAHLSLNHRQQWRGIEDAPVTSLVSFDMAISDRLNVGVKIVNDQKSILNSTTGYLTLGYTLPLSGNRMHTLSFGLSGGMRKQSIDTDESFNYNDPAVVALFNTSTNLLAEFGMYYRYANLDVGIALPALFNRDFNNETASLAPLNEWLLMTSYIFVLSENALSFEPHLLYRKDEQVKGQLEVTGIFEFYETFRIGGVFRQHYGASALVGINIGDNVKLGYAYELASTQVNGYANGSHEIDLSLDFGERIKKIKLFKPRFKH